jgi:hypothetical protein
MTALTFTARFQWNLWAVHSTLTKAYPEWLRSRARSSTGGWSNENGARLGVRMHPGRPPLGS